MKQKQILILAVIFALLVMGIILKKTQHPAELATEEYSSLAMNFDSSLVSRIAVYKQKSGHSKEKPQVDVVKKEGVWKLPALWNALADQDKITPFLDEVKKMKGELRSRSKKVFGDFSITDEEGFHVSLSDASGKEILGIVIGSKKPDYSKVFVRKSGADEVYVTEANLFPQIGVFGKPEADEPQADYWASKKYVSFDSAKVKKIESLKFEKGAQVSSLVLIKEAGIWKFLDKQYPFPPGPEKVTQYLNGIRDNRAEKVLDPKAKDYGFQKPRRQFRLTLETGSPVELTVGEPDTKDESSFYFQSAGEPSVFLLSKYYIENMSVEADWFLGDNPLGIDQTKVEKLVIHADKTEKSFQPLVKKWDALTSYLEGLKNFKLDKAAAGKPRFGKYWIEIKKQGEAESVIIDVADAPVVLGDLKSYPAQKRGAAYPFSITPVLFSQLFDNLSRLDEPK